MSNVKYVCYTNPDFDPTGCQSVLFDAPGGTKLRCRRHPDQTFVQYEDWQGGSFAYQGDKDHPVSKKPENPNVDLSGLPPQVIEKEQLQKEYEEVFGVAPDARWGAKTLKEEIENKRKEQS